MTRVACSCGVAAALAVALAWAGAARAETPPPHSVEHVRLPSFDGVELDGAAPTLAYPPRPFLT